LLRRGRTLLPPGSDERAGLAPDLAIALIETGEVDEAIVVTSEAMEAQDPVLRARAIVTDAEVRGGTPSADSAKVWAKRDDARTVLEEAQDDLGLAQYWRARGFDFWSHLQADKAREAWEHGLPHAEAAGAKRVQYELQSLVLSALFLGPAPVAEALPRAEAALAEAPAGSLSEASAQRVVGSFRSCQGLAEEGRLLHVRGLDTFREAGLLVTAGGWAMSLSEIEWRAGDLEAAERVLREGFESLDRLGDHYFFSTVALRLADCLLLTRAPDDAEVARICRVARERTLEADLVNFVYLDAIEGRRLVHAGSEREGIELARKATATADETDNFDVRSHAWYGFAEALLLAGELEESAVAAARSIEIRTAKGDVAGAAALERRYVELGVRPA
jgi:tetratricopeptide (TPR) repeat protein